jgi:hypothetical protein
MPPSPRPTQRKQFKNTLLCYSRFLLKTLTSICIAAGLPLPVDGPRAADRLAAATSTKLRTGRCGYRGLVVPKRCIGCWLSGCRIGCLNAVPVGSVFAGSRSGACTCWKRNYRLRCQNTVPVRERRAAPVARLPVDPLATSQSGHRVLFHIQAKGGLTGKDCATGLPAPARALAIPPLSGACAANVALPHPKRFFHGTST